MKHKATLPFSVSWHYDKNVLNGTPVSKKAIGELVWAHFLDTGTICLYDPKEQPDKVRIRYEKVQDARMARILGAFGMDHTEAFFTE